MTDKKKNIREDKTMKSNNFLTRNKKAILFTMAFISTGYISAEAIKYSWYADVSSKIKDLSGQHQLGVHKIEIKDIQEELIDFSLNPFSPVEFQTSFTLSDNGKIYKNIIFRSKLSPDLVLPKASMDYEIILNNSEAFKKNLKSLGFVEFKNPYGVAHINLSSFSTKIDSDLTIPSLKGDQVYFPENILTHIRLDEDKISFSTEIPQIELRKKDQALIDSRTPNLLDNFQNNSIKMKGVSISYNKNIKENNENYTINVESVYTGAASKISGVKIELVSKEIRELINIIASLEVKKMTTTKESLGDLTLIIEAKNEAKKMKKLIQVLQKKDLTKEKIFDLAKDLNFNSKFLLSDSRKKLIDNLFIEGKYTGPIDNNYIKGLHLKAKGYLDNRFIPVFMQLKPEALQSLGISISENGSVLINLDLEEIVKNLK